MFEEGENTPEFELDPKEFQYHFEICWICKHRFDCPLQWECETLANLVNDNSKKRDE